MSYGWLTESSLQPRTGQSIEVPSNTLKCLKTALQKAEENVKQRRDEIVTSGHERLGVTGSSRPAKRFRVKGEKLMDEKNLNIEKRQIKDEQYHTASEKSFSNVTKRLEEKAKLYEGMMLSGECKTDGRRLGGVKPLVDFEAKKNVTCVSMAASRNTAAVSLPVVHTDSVERRVGVVQGTQEGAEVLKNDCCDGNTRVTKGKSQPIAHHTECAKDIVLTTARHDKLKAAATIAAKRQMGKEKLRLELEEMRRQKRMCM